jgi:hypothetical protein
LRATFLTSPTYFPPHLQDLWVEHVVKNPQYKSSEAGRKQQLPPAFEQKLEEYVTALPGFR